jgi:hypothetical protein
MEPATREFLKQLFAIRPELAINYKRAVADWAPDEYPLTIAFGDIGADIVKRFPSLDILEAVELFDFLETGMADRGSELHTAVATGLFEAMLGSNSREQWPNIRPLLGPRSAAFCG